MPRAGVPLGFCFDRRSDPSAIPFLARQLEANGFDDLWVVEDCFSTTGTSLAAAALASSQTLTVGVGLLPAVTRHPALTAMELATLARLAPGRVWAGIGHGVQSWMAQMGLRQRSPVRALDETLRVVRELLAGREVTMAGTFAHLDRIQLEDPPALPPPVLAGVRGPVSLAMAGRAADGLLLAEYTGLAGVRSAVTAAGRDDDFPVVTYTATHVEIDRDHARRVAADTIAGVLASPPPSRRDAAYFEEASATVARHGPAALPGLPDEIWTDLAAVGDPDDLAAHVEGCAPLAPTASPSRPSTRTRPRSRPHTSPARYSRADTDRRKPLVELGEILNGLVKRLVVPDGSAVPRELARDGIRATAITRHDLDDDVRGINASLDLIRRTRGGRWPTGPVTHEDNYVDLVWHECEFRDGGSYTYVVRDDDGRYLGCAYLYPMGGRTRLTEELLAYDVDVSWWVTEQAYAEGYYHKLAAALEHWVRHDTPFEAPYVSNVEVP